MKIEHEYILYEEGDAFCTTLLIDMTNEYIDYRNQVFDGSCMRDTMQIPEDSEEYEYVDEMDMKIRRVRDYLDTL